MDTNLSRRNMLGIAAGTLAAGVLGSQAAGSAEEKGASRLRERLGGRALRIVHMTDTHIQPELAGGEGVAACLKHINAMADKPDLILTGGDHVMDSFDQGFDRTKALWDLWRSVVKNECSTPMLSVLGNHDHWGWNKAKSKTRGDEKGWGKAYALEHFGREKPYGSVERAGWRLVLLDSVRMDKDDPAGYEAFLDEEQFDWLAKELAAAAGKPTLILSATIFDGRKPNAKGDWEISGGLMHTDYARLNTLFQKHPNVKACLSGHIHLVDRVEYNGVKYFCNGAVSGGWWKGDHKTCKPGYAVLDLFEDGTLTNEYVPYGWEARKG